MTEHCDGSVPPARFPRFGSCGKIKHSIGNFCFELEKMEGEQVNKVKDRGKKKQLYFFGGCCLKIYIRFKFSQAIATGPAPFFRLAV